jgi:hypothetical protein
MLKRLLSIIVYLLFANSAWASGITDIKFGRYQIADSQWNVHACLNTNTCQIYSKNPGVAYKIPWTSGQVQWAAGDYVKFDLSGNGSFPYTAKQYNSAGAVKAILGNGKIVNMGADYFFFVGSDNNTGQLFSGSSGMNSTAGVTWTGTTNPTIAQADTYADQNYSTTPLAPGQTAGPPPPPPPPSLCCGGSAAPLNANAAFTSRAQNFAAGNSNNSVYIEQIGNSNNITVTQQGNKNYMSIYNNGSNSTIQTNQTSTNSTVSNYTELSLLGNNNNVNIAQQSTAGAKGITSTITENTNTEDKGLVAGDGCQQKEITLKSGAGDLDRGTVLAMNTTTYKWTQLNIASGSTGENVARAILAQDTNASVREMKAQAFFIGKYRFDDLIFETAATRLQKDNACKELADVGIIVDEDFSTAATTTTTTTTNERRKRRRRRTR